jgi:hypothetical protein
MLLILEFLGGMPSVSDIALDDSPNTFEHSILLERLDTISKMRTHVESRVAIVTGHESRRVDTDAIPIWGETTAGTSTGTDLYIHCMYLHASCGVDPFLLHHTR